MLIKNIRSYLFAIFASIVLLGCSAKNIDRDVWGGEIANEEEASISDLNLPQDAMFYQKNVESGLEDRLKIDSPTLKDEYKKMHFSPWEKEPDTNKNVVFWVIPGILKNRGYGEHLQLNSKKYIQSIVDNMNLAEYPSASKKAIVIKHSDVRVVPTIKPRYSKKGGYPIDRWQNSLIFAGTPILVTHYDTTKRWAHIESSFVYGWVEADRIAYIKDSDAQKALLAEEFVAPIRDNIPLYDSDSAFVRNGRVGEVFEVIKDKSSKKDEISIVAYGTDKDGYAKRISLKAKSDDFAPFPLPFTTENMAKVINSMMGQRYGWGGILENRDCSSFIRDSFATFGVWLPRNSKQQALHKDRKIDISGLSRDDKEQFIIKNGIPFGTTIWMSGHIMLYIGHYEGRVMIAHSAWSVSSKTLFSQEENLLGGVVITTLYAGREKNSMLRKSKLIIDRIGSISNIYDYEKRED